MTKKDQKLPKITKKINENTVGNSKKVQICTSLPSNNLKTQIKWDGGTDGWMYQLTDTVTKSRVHATKKKVSGPPKNYLNPMENQSK